MEGEARDRYWADKYVLRVSSFIRGKPPVTESLRVVEPYEEFRMQGVDLCEWKPICATEDIDQKLLDFLSDMVGCIVFIIVL